MKPVFIRMLLMLTLSLAPVLSQVTDNNNGDEVIRELMSVNPGVEERQLIAYTKECERTARKFRDAAPGIRTEFYKRIGDLYYDLDKVHNARKWGHWYRMVAALDTGMVSSTPIGYRFGEYKKITLRENLFLGAYTIYALLALMILFRFVRNSGRFDAQFFLRRAGLFFLVYSAFAGIVFIADATSFHTYGAAFIPDDVEGGSSDNPRVIALVKPLWAFVRPAAPFSVFDFTNAGPAAIILLLGFIPCLLALLWVSFGKRASGVVITTVVLLSTISLWTNYFVETGFDSAMRSKVAVTGTRVIYRGELEKLFPKYPQKIMRANRNLLKSVNSDLKVFVAKNFPNGIPEKGK